MRRSSSSPGRLRSAPDVLEFFQGLGVEICEGYGLTESTGVGAVNVPGEIRIGTVGRPSGEIEIELAEDGEILIRGGIVMAGYRGEPEKTAEAIDPQGWLHTGDIGRIDDDGYLSVIDRKKELIINAAGKNMSPANIEAHLKAASPLISFAVAIGDGRRYNTALFSLDPDALALRAQREGIADASPGDDVQGSGVARRARGRGRGSQLEDVTGRADQALERRPRRLGAGRQAGYADDQVEAQADPGGVRRADRVDVSRRLDQSSGPAARAASRYVIGVCSATGTFRNGKGERTDESRPLVFAS